jgi:hypothetical protein
MLEQQDVKMYSRNYGGEEGFYMSTSQSED